MNLPTEAADEKDETLLDKDLITKSQEYVIGSCEPLMRSFSKEGLTDAALYWMRKNYKCILTQDRYHEKLGFLIDFVTDLSDGKTIPEVL